eukprot:COSAG02_NODE_31744_length_528_cov_0.834499_1_plen_45_part_10
MTSVHATTERVTMSIREALDLVNSNKFITSQLTPEQKSQVQTALT